MSNINLGDLGEGILNVLRSKGGTLDADVRQMLREHLLRHELQGVSEEEKEERLASIDAFLEGAPNIFVMSARSIARALEHAEKTAAQSLEGVMALAKSMKSPKEIFLTGGVVLSVSLALDCLREAQTGILAAATTAQFHGPEEKKEGMKP